MSAPETVLVRVRLQGAIAWKLREPWSEVVLPAFGGLAVLSPLVSRDVDLHDGESILVADDGSLILRSGFLTLRVEADIRRSHRNWPDKDSMLHAIAQRLRYVSGQVEVPRRAVSWAWGIQAGTVTWPAKFMDVDCELGERFFNRLLTRELLERAGESREVPPPFHFLMDAVEAMVVCDHARAILYAAVAAGVSASQLRIDELATGLKGDDLTVRLREVDGKWEDPVLKVLRSRGFPQAPSRNPLVPVRALDAPL